MTNALSLSVTTPGAISSHSSPVVDNQTAAIIRAEIQSQYVVDTSAQVFSQFCVQLRSLLKAAMDENTALKSRVIVEETALKVMSDLHEANQKADQQRLVAVTAELNALLKKHSDLTTTIDLQTKTVVALKSTNTALQNSVTSLTTTNNSLTKEINDLKNKYHV